MKLRTIIAGTSKMFKKIWWLLLGSIKNWRNDKTMRIQTKELSEEQKRMGQEYLNLPSVYRGKPNQQ